MCSIIGGSNETQSARAYREGVANRGGLSLSPMVRGQYMVDGRGLLYRLDV